MAEAISKPELNTDKEPTVELEKVPLIGSTHDVVVVEYSFRSANTVDKCTAEISRVCATYEAEYRLLEVRLRSQLERCEKVSERVVGCWFADFGNRGRCWIGRSSSVKGQVR